MAAYQRVSNWVVRFSLEYKAADGGAVKPATIEELRALFFCQPANRCHIIQLPPLPVINEALTRLALMEPDTGGFLANLSTLGRLARGQAMESTGPCCIDRKAFLAIPVERMLLYRNFLALEYNQFVPLLHDIAGNLGKLPIVSVGLNDDGNIHIVLPNQSGMGEQVMQFMRTANQLD